MNPQPFSSRHRLGASLLMAAVPVARIWRDHGLNPHRVESFNDTRFVEKLEDIVGLYLDPPAGAGALLRQEDADPGA